MCSRIKHINYIHINNSGGTNMKCMFYPEIDCPSYLAQKELGYEPNPNEIQKKACPQCPYGPNSFKRNRGDIHQNILENWGKNIPEFG